MSPSPPAHGSTTVEAAQGIGNLCKVQSLLLMTSKIVMLLEIDRVYRIIPYFWKADFDFSLNYWCANLEGRPIIKSAQ